MFSGILGRGGRGKGDSILTKGYTRAEYSAVRLRVYLGSKNGGALKGEGKGERGEGKGERRKGKGGSILRLGFAYTLGQIT